LHVNVTNTAGANAVETFLVAHDDQLVYVEIECDDYGTNLAFGKLDPSTHCYVEEKGNITESSKKGFSFGPFQTTEVNPETTLHRRCRPTFHDHPKERAGVLLMVGVVTRR
jgi:hypothetical protein